MAKGRRRSNLQWYGFTDEGASDPNGDGNVPLFNVSDVSSGISGFGTTVPSGTLLKTFVRCTISIGSFPQNSFALHVIGALRMDEAVQDGASLSIVNNEIASAGGLGFEDLLTLDSIVVWRNIFQPGTIDDSETKLADMLHLESSSKRRLEENDVMIFDYGTLALPADLGQRSLDYALDARILIKQG